MPFHYVCGNVRCKVAMKWGTNRTQPEIFNGRLGATCSKYGVSDSNLSMLRAGSGFPKSYIRVFWLKFRWPSFLVNHLHSHFTMPKNILVPRIMLKNPDEGQLFHCYPNYIEPVLLQNRPYWKSTRFAMNCAGVLYLYTQIVSTGARRKAIAAAHNRSKPLCLCIEHPDIRLSRVVCDTISILIPHTNPATPPTTLYSLWHLPFSIINVKKNFDNLHELVVVLELVMTILLINKVRKIFIFTIAWAHTNIHIVECVVCTGKYSLVYAWVCWAVAATAVACSPNHRAKFDFFSFPCIISDRYYFIQPAYTRMCMCIIHYRFRLLLLFFFHLLSILFSPFLVSLCICLVFCSHTYIYKYIPKWMFI